MQHTTFTFPPDSERVYLQEAIEEILSAYRTGVATYSLDIPPRSGKSNILYCVAAELAEEAPFVLVISPWVFLRDQIVDTTKIADHCKMYQVTCEFSVDTIEGVDAFAEPSWWDFKESPTIFSTTLRKADVERTNLATSVALAVEQTGRKPIIVFDEAHVLGEANECAKLYGALHDAGAFVLTMTGTFYRSNKGPICGANVEKLKCNENVKKQLRRRLDSKTVEVRDLVGSVTKYTMKADKSVPWKVAWDVGAMARIDGRYVDVEVGDKYISGFDKEDIKNGVLREALESVSGVETFCLHTVLALEEAKSENADTWNAAGMVVVGTDLPGTAGDDRHARQVKDQLQLEAEKRGHEWRIQIITMNTDSDNNTGVEKLNDFRDGFYDIVVVKMMGLVGLDVERLSVLALMSTLRGGPMLGQAITRPLTMWAAAGAFKPKLLMLEDPYMVEAYDQLVASQGGGTARKADMETVSITTIPLDAVPFDAEIGDARVRRVVDENSLTAAEDDVVAKCSILRDKYKMLSRNCSEAELMTALKAGEVSVTEDELAEWKSNEPQRPIVKNQKVVRAMYKAKFNKLTKKYANARHSYIREQKKWVKCRAKIASEAKRYAGIESTLAAEKDPARLEAATVYLKEAL